MKVLVTGGLGFIGRAVTVQLRDAGHEVVAMTRRSPSKITDVPAGVRLVTGDLSSLQTVSRICAAEQFEGICHLAARTNRDGPADALEYWRVNVTGTWNLLRAVSDMATDHTPLRIVFASTCVVYQAPTPTRPLHERDAVSPGNPYAVTKSVGEQLLDMQVQAMSEHLGAMSLRVFAAAGAADGHGDPDESRILPKMLAVAGGAFDRMEIHGDGTAMRDFVHVQDVADAFHAALQVARPGVHEVINVGTGAGTSIRDVLAVVERVTSRQIPVVHRPARAEQAALIADPSRAAEVLNWQPKRSTIEEIVRSAWQAVITQWH